MQQGLEGPVWVAEKCKVTRLTRATSAVRGDLRVNVGSHYEAHRVRRY